MAKKSTVEYVCQECGSIHSKWAGKCDDCGQWNSIVEETSSISSVYTKPKNDNKANKKKLEIHDLSSPVQDFLRTHTGINEFDRVLGGGLVKGSATLLGGDPGIGKSTLLLQACASLTANGHECLYITGEESIEQVKLRAQRLGLSGDTKIATATLLTNILNTIDIPNAPGVVIIDSIQTMYHDALDSAPGTVTQVRACAFELIRIAKQRGISLIFVGHVTKEGQIAGPKVLEHMVDTVLYFEGERGHQFRIIRAVKNRFGAANEIGVFEMADTGLQEVPNPSAVFLPTRDENVSGSCIFAGLEGTRPVLLEIQALVSPSYLASPRRAVVGWDNNRLAMMIAVLNSRYGINLLDKEVYLNVAGGLKVNEPAADLAVMAALISAAKDIPINREYVFFGEVGLSGELRQVVHSDVRLNEAAKLGFKKAIIPYQKKKKSCKIDYISVKQIYELEKIFKGN